MNKICARCSKTVYTIEELKCLDKIWHKGCFKCQACGMTLNMRNYKGFDKQPYCEAHVPRVKPTTMAETPELRRIAENTKIQSNVKYHEDFEKSKGKFTQVVDDPEIKRIQQNSKIISNVAYHGELEKKAAMEQKRSVNENGHNNNNSNFNTINNESRNPVNVASLNNTNRIHEDTYETVNSIATNHNLKSSSMHPIGKISDYEPVNNSPYSSRQNPTLIYTSDRGAVHSLQQLNIGSIADIDPLNNVYGSITKSTSSEPIHSNISGRIYRAMYDYDAQDVDEVTFCEGDLIVNVTNIHAGWMTGQIQRTGQIGMLPANYVELVHI